MIGDFIIWIKKVWKQQVTCRHDYKKDNFAEFHFGYSTKRCTKCGKTKYGK